MTNQEIHESAKHNLEHLFESAMTETGPMIPLAEAKKMGTFSLDVYRTMLAETLKYRLAQMSEEDQNLHRPGLGIAIDLLQGQ